MRPHYSFLNKVLIAAIVLFIIYGLAIVAAQYTLPYLSVINKASFAQKNFISKSYLLLFTVIAMLLFKRLFKIDYGLIMGTNLSYSTYLKKGVLFGLLGLLLVMICNIVGFVLTRQKPAGFPPEQLRDRILFIWIWSSVVEELLFRGFIQSYLETTSNHLFKIGKAVISGAVFFSALFFGALHLFLLMQGMSVFFVAGIFANAFLLGLVAGYYREKTGSLWPAIFLHIIFNLVGSIPLLLQR